MERTKLKEQISTLEEQLELLGDMVVRNGAYAAGAEGRTYDQSEDELVRNAMRSLKGLRELVHEQSFAKSLPAEDFLQKIAGVLIREAHAMGFEISLSTFGSGRISMEMVELSMGAVLACVRASLRTYAGMDRSVRSKHNLFGAYSFYLEAKATDNDVHFRLFDDGQGYSADFHAEFEAEKQFQKIRTYIARNGGWFSRRSLPGVGGAIEFKVPLPLSRFECLVLQRGEFQVLVPSACVAEVEANPQLDSLGGVLAMPGSEHGLEPVSVGQAAGAGVAVKIGVADFQFWLLADVANKRVTARRHVAGDLVETGCWFGFLGIFHEGNGLPQALPLLDGEALMQFHAKAGS